MSRYFKWFLIIGALLLVPFTVTLNYIKWVLISAVVTVFLFSATLNYMSTYLFLDHDLVEADAIVVLMGGIDARIPETVDLYRDGYAKEIIMVQVYTEGNEQSAGSNIWIVDETKQARAEAIERGIPAEKIIIIPGQARNTWDEAVAVRDYLVHRTDINSLILVTFTLHTRRTFTTFERVLGCLDRDIVLISRAARYDVFDYEDWWLEHRSVYMVIQESLKVIYYYFLWLFSGCCVYR